MSNSKHYMARTRDWISFSKTELFFDPGFQTIDASLAEHEGNYYMAVKDESHVYDPLKFPHPPMNFLAVSQHLEGPYERGSNIQTPNYTEGPEFLWIEREQKWLLIYDYWAYGKFGIMESKDMLHWSGELDASCVRFPFQARHATVTPIGKAELRGLLDRYALLAHYRTPTYSPVRIAAWEQGGFLHDAFSMRTVSMQVRPNSVSGIQVLYDEGDAINGLALRICEGRVEAAVRSNGTLLKLTSKAGLLAKSEWQEVSLVYDEGRLILSVNDVTVQEQASYVLVRSHDGPGGYGGRFGEDAFGDSDGQAVLDGAIRHVRIYSIPLTEDDIISSI